MSRAYAIGKSLLRANVAGRPPSSSIPPPPAAFRALNNGSTSLAEVRYRIVLSKDLQSFLDCKRFVENPTRVAVPVHSATRCLEMIDRYGNLIDLLAIDGKSISRRQIQILKDATSGPLKRIKIGLVMI